MFRDLKEYQEIAKIYADKVSKPENLEENQANRMKMKQQRTAQNQGRAAQQFSALKPKPIQGRISRSSQNMAGKPKPTPVQTKQPAPEAKPAPQAQPAPQAKPQSKFMKSDKGTGFVKRGTPGAQRAENIEKNRNRAKEMAKARIAAKKDGTAKPQMSGKERAQEMARARLAAKNKPSATPVKSEPTAQAKPAATPSGDKLKAGSFGISAKGKKQAAANKAEVANKKPVSGNTSSMNVSAGTPTRKVTSSTTQSGNTTSTKTKVTSGTGGGTEGLTKSAGSLEDNKKKAERMRKIAAQNAAMEAEFESKQFDAYDLVLEYLLSSEQVATIEEANYVMTEMDAETIQGIVEEQKKNFDEGAGVAAAALAGGLLTYGLYKRNQYKKDAEKRDEKTNFGKIQKATDANNKMLRDAGMGGN